MKPSFLMAVAAFLWSTFPLAIAQGVASYNYAALYCVGIGISALAHFLYLLRIRQRFAAVVRAHFGDILRWGGMASLAITVASFAYYYAMTSSHKVEAAILLEFWPVLSMLFGVALLSRTHWDNVPAYAWLCAALAFAGSVILLLDRVGGIQTWNLNHYTLFAFLGAVFYGLSGNLQAVLGARLELASEFDKTVIVRFFADFLSFLLALAVIPFFEVDWVWDGGFLLSTLYLGVLIYTASAFFFNHSLRLASSPSINLLFYIAPVIGVVWLDLFDYGDITRFAVLGASLILISNVLVSSEYRYAPSTMYTLVFILFFQLVTILFEGFPLRDMFVYMEISGGIFAIVAGFSLTRLHQKAGDEEVHRVAISNTGYRLASLVQEHQPEKFNGVRRKLDDLFTTIVDYELCTDKHARTEILGRIYHQEEELDRLCRFLLAGTPHQESGHTLVHELMEQIDSWIAKKSDNLSNGELIAISLLGLVPVGGLLLNQAENLFASVSAVFLATGIVYIVLKIVDLDRGQGGKDFSSLLSTQQMFRRLNLDYYLPYSVIRNMTLPPPPHPVAFRYQAPGSQAFEVACFKREGFLVRNLGGLLFLVAFLVFFLLLLDKYGILPLPRLL